MRGPLFPGPVSLRQSPLEQVVLLASSHLTLLVLRHRAVLHCSLFIRSWGIPAITVTSLVPSIPLVTKQSCLTHCLLQLCLQHCLRFTPWILSFITGGRLAFYYSVANHISVISCCCSIRALLATASYATIFITFYAASSRQSSRYVAPVWIHRVHDI